MYTLPPPFHADALLRHAVRGDDDFCGARQERDPRRTCAAWKAYFFKAAYPRSFDARMSASRGELGSSILAPRMGGLSGCLLNWRKG